MARPLSPREATEMILALRRQQGDSPSYRHPSARRAKRSDAEPKFSTTSKRFSPKKA